MTEMDSGAFETAFKRLSGALQWRGRPGEFEHMRQEYFDALRPFALDEVLAAAQVCRDTLKRFPRIVEWKAALAAGPSATGKPPDARWMRQDEAREYVRATRQAFADAPCMCLDCQAAGVADLAVRYVPDFAIDDRPERAWCGLIDKMATVGHWAHGEELARWYAARDRFYALGPALKPFARVLQLAGIAREPGEEG